MSLMYVDFAVFSLCFGSFFRKITLKISFGKNGISSR